MSKKWKIKCEDRVYFYVTVEAETQEEAEDKVARASWNQHGRDVYEILSIEEIDSV